MAEQRFERDGTAPEREMTPAERAAMEFATRNLDEDIRALLATRQTAWAPQSQASAPAERPSA